MNTRWRAFTLTSTGDLTMLKRILAILVLRVLLLLCIFGLASSLRALPDITPQITIRSNDIQVVAATLILEAGGEGAKGMEAVREVIANRSRGSVLTEAEVCLKRLQFSCWNGRTVSSGIEKAKAHKRWALALAIAKAETTNHTNGATHYHTNKVSPSWSKKLEITAKIGNHTFLK